MQDGVLVAAASEERFSRAKYDPRLPLHAFDFCLKKAGLDVSDVDVVAYYESPQKKLSRQLWAGPSRGSSARLPWLDARRPEREIRELFGFEGELLRFEHHQSHAASAYYFSGFDDAAVMTMDAVGEWTTTAYGTARGPKLELIEQVEFPHSLGILYSAVTSYLGFAVNDGEYKVMGLAPYGAPRFVEQVRKLVHVDEGGGFRLDLDYFDFLRGARMYSDSMVELFGAPARAAESDIQQFHQDVAKSLQVVLEEILIGKARWLHGRFPSQNLCMAGGVALNCVANGHVLKDGPFERLFVQPAAGDAGGSVGAAALAHVAKTGARPQHKPLRHSYFGASYDADACARLVAATGVPFIDHRGHESELLEAVVDRLVAGKVVGWFHGPMEFGPRALGARSILADPRDPGMRERLNALVKLREAFRPFAPSVLERAAAEHFELDHPAPFMLETCQVRSSFSLPAITHVDGSARPQTVSPDASRRYHALIEAFARRTGCPILVNTSFNIRGEPIVCSPLDGLLSLVRSGIDTLVLEDLIVDRASVPAEWTQRLAALESHDPFGATSAIPENVYTFL